MPAFCKMSVCIDWGKETKVFIAAGFCAKAKLNPIGRSFCFIFKNTSFLVFAISGEIC